MKKIFLTLLLIPLAACKLQAASLYSCRDSFYSRPNTVIETANPHAYENPVFEKAMQAARDKIETHQQIVLRKNRVFLGFFRKKYFKPTTIQFNNQKFITKREEYKEALLSPTARTSLMKSDQLNPKNIEESLALFEAIADLDPEISGMHVIKDWLLTASEKDVKKMSQILHFDADRRPADLQKAITMMYFMTHSPKDSLSDIINNGFDEYVARAVYQHVAISVFSESLLAGMKDLGIREPKTLNAMTFKVFNKSENSLRVGYNVALTALATGHPIFMLLTLAAPAIPADLKLVASAVQNLTPRQRGDILDKNFINLPPALVSRFFAASAPQLAWKAFINTLYYATTAYMIYVIEEDIRYHFTNTKDPKTRAWLQQTDLAIWEISCKQTNIDPTQDREGMLETFQKMKDSELQDFYDANSHRLQESQQKK